MKMEYLIGALLGGFLVHLWHTASKPHHQPKTTGEKLSQRPCKGASGECPNHARQGSDYCEEHKWYEPQYRN